MVSRCVLNATRMERDLVPDIPATTNSKHYNNALVADTDGKQTAGQNSNFSYPNHPYTGSAKFSLKLLQSGIRDLSSSANVTSNNPPVHPTLTQYQSSSFDDCLEETQSSTRKIKAKKDKRMIHGSQKKLQFSQKSNFGMLPPDLEARIYKKICMSLGKKYGSLERATQAAVTMQKAYRGYKLRMHFDEIRKEGSSPMSKYSPTVTKERRQMLSTVKQQALDLSDTDSIAGLSDSESLNVSDHQGVLNGGAPDADAFVTSKCDNGDVHCLESSARTSTKCMTRRRCKSLSSTTTQLCLVEDDEGKWEVKEEVEEEGEEEGEEEEGEEEEGEEEEGEEEEGEEEDAHWNRMVGIYLFNRKPASGIQYLISKGIVRDTPKSVARFLREQDGLSKLKIGEFVGEIRYEFNMAVLEHLAHSINMKDKPIDEALREFQTLFLMPGEAQKIDKIMQIFALEYIDANDLQIGAEDSTRVLSVLEYLSTNQSEFETVDAVYVLSFSIMMLHTSLHNPSVKNRTTKEQWLKMNRGINGGRNFSNQFLLRIYDRIQETSFVTGNDHTQKVAEIQKRLVGSDILKQSAPHRCFVNEVTVYELDKVNSWKRGKHKRVLLMFNDLVVVAKKNKEQYMFKQSFSLLNATAVSYQSADLPDKYGVQIYSSLDKSLLFQCCCETQIEYEILLKNLNDSKKLLNLLEKVQITASQEQAYLDTNIRMQSMKAGTPIKLLSKAKSTTALHLHAMSLCPRRLSDLSALSMRLENLNLLDNVSGSVDKAHIHSLSRSMRNIKSLEVPSFDGLEETSFDVETSFDSVKSLDEVEDLHQIHTPARVTMSEQDQECYLMERWRPGACVMRTDSCSPYVFETKKNTVDPQ